MDFINLFIEYTKEYESPTSFWKWAAYTAIASVCRDNVHTKFGELKIYPNIYTLLLADSAVHRKGNPVKVCERLVHLVRNTKVISGRSSIQAILDELSRGETNPETGKILKGGSCLFSAPELSAGIVSDPDAVKILTDIYDFREEYTSRLRGSGLFKIQNVCFTMMAASNEDLLREVYDTKAIFGGLLGRTFLVKPDEFRPANSLFHLQNGHQHFEQMINELQGMSKKFGEMEFSEDAIKEYEGWYEEFRESYRDKPDKSGIAGRLHTGVIKLAMIFCMNRQQTLCVMMEDVRKAIDECIALIPNYKTFLMASGKSILADVATTIINEIWAAEGHCSTKRRILQKYWNQFDAETFDKATDTLTQAGMLQTMMVENEIMLSLTQKCIEIIFKNEAKGATNAKS
jgi:hypothetical protein